MKEGDSAPDNSTPTGLQTQDPGQGQDVEGLDLFISLQIPLREEALDEADNINGRQVDLRGFNSRLLVVWAQVPRKAGKACNKTFQALFQYKARTHVQIGLWCSCPAAWCSVIISWQLSMETQETRAGRQGSSGHRKCAARIVGA